MKKNPPELESRDLSSTKEKNSQRLRKEVHVVWLCTTNMKKREGDVLSKQTQQSNNEEKQCLPVRCPTMSHQNKLSRATFYPFLDNKWQYMLPTLAFLVSHPTIKSKDDQFFWFLLLGFLLRTQVSHGFFSTSTLPPHGTRVFETRVSSLNLSFKDSIY